MLPDGQTLVAQKVGGLLRLSADGRTTVAQTSGVPAVAATGQGGLLDVALDPDFAARPGWPAPQCCARGGPATRGSTQR